MHFFSKKQILKLQKYLKVKKIHGKNEERLWKKVSTYSPIFSKIPGILCICVGNSLAMNAAHKNSDIDLFIITQNNRIWTSRLFITILLTLLGERKTTKKHAGKFCLSFFITENSMDLKNIAIEDDIYLSYWIQTLKPIVDKDDIFERFQVANSLLNPHSLQEQGAQQKQLQSLSLVKGENLERVCDCVKLKVLGNLLESLLKSIFLPRTKKSFQKLGKPFGVIISDNMLKFHDKDKRKEIRDAIFS